jgi:hypothetical protein
MLRKDACYVSLRNEHTKINCICSNSTQQSNVQQCSVCEFQVPLLVRIYLFSRRRPSGWFRSSDCVLYMTSDGQADLACTLGVSGQHFRDRKRDVVTKAMMLQCRSVRV